MDFVIPRHFCFPIAWKMAEPANIIWEIPIKIKLYLTLPCKQGPTYMTLPTSSKQNLS